MSSQLDSEDFKLSHWLLLMLLPHTVLFLLGTSLCNDQCLLPTFCLHLLSLFFNYLPFLPIYGNFLSLNFLPVLNKGKLPSAYCLHTGVGSAWIHPTVFKFSEYFGFLATCSHLFTRWFLALYGYLTWKADKAVCASQEDTALSYMVSLEVGLDFTSLGRNVSKKRWHNPFWPSVSLPQV